jgi:hypothetical protein
MNRNAFAKSATISEWAHSHSVQAPPERIVERTEPSCQSRASAPFLYALSGYDKQRCVATKFLTGRYEWFT